jgi:multiple sugar transport system permease protein
MTNTAAAAEEKVKKEKKVKVKKTKSPMTKDRFRKILMGTKDDMGLLKKIVVYVILTCVGFIFVYPLLKVLSTSLMSLADLFDSSINWLPSKFQTVNYKVTMKAMNYWKSLKDSFIVSGVPTLCQVVSCSIVGYGLARYNFKGRNLIFGLIIFSFVLPTSLTLSTQYQMYNSMGWTGTLLTFVVPAIFANGLKSQLFILICWSFFKQIPPVLNEAASIDGAGHLKSFVKIALPSASGALIVVLIFSFVWYWNEQYLSQLYLYSKVSSSNYTPLINQLASFSDSFSSTYSSTTGASNSATINDAYRMAATILTIIPLLIIYAILQKQFVESVDRAGITGE